MQRSYSYIREVSPIRRSPRRSIELSALSSRRSTTCETKESTFRHGLTFIGSLLLAAATIDAAPVIALAALALMAWAVNQINKEEKKCLRNL